MEVVGADSRQFYSEMSIGTAVPSAQELAEVKHHFIQDRSVINPLSAGTYATEAQQLIEKLSSGKSTNEIVAVVVGGSGLYIDALLGRLDDIPSNSEIRDTLNQTFRDQGLAPLLQELKEVDPTYYEMVDRNNPQRVIRALEVCKTTAEQYSSLRKGEARTIEFDPIEIILDFPREELYSRINQRVDMMIDMGLEAEARSVEKYRELNPLRTVGYSELFDYFDGNTSLDKAIDLIKQHTRNYAKRQLTWLTRNSTSPRFAPLDIDKITQHIESPLITNQNHPPYGTIPITSEF